MSLFPVRITVRAERTGTLLGKSARRELSMTARSSIERRVQIVMGIGLVFLSRLGELDRALTFDDIDAVLAHYHVPGLEIQDSLTRIRADALGLRLLYQPLVDQHTARISGYQSVGTVHG